MNAWLLDTLLYTGLLIALVLLVRRPVGRMFGPHIAYALWALPFVRLLLPPVVLPAGLAPEPGAAFLFAAETPVAVSPATLPDGWAPAAVPLDRTEAASPALAWDWAMAGEAALSVWLGGALAFLAWRIVTYRRMRRDLLADARPVGEVGAIRLVETPELAAPVAFGVRDKVIGLPPGFMAQEDIVARDLAIAHEVAHHRGRDLLANFAAQALLAMHWFNPLAWFGWRAMRRDQEAACDARVLAGRGPDERQRYAVLIAGIAAGPRLALAAPMACPVLGENSIIHRLRSLSMSEITPGRRWFGRGLVGAAMLALPLTASISYSTAIAQEPVSPAAPAAPSARPSHALPAVPQPPAIGEVRQARTVTVRGEGPDGEPIGSLPAPPMPPNVREFQFRSFDPGDPLDPEFEARMEQFGRDMERWGEQFSADMEGRALAWSEAARFAPEVIESCDEGEARRTVTADGRQRVVICAQRIRAQALAGARSGLRGARAAIAGNPHIAAEARDEILRDLDQEIARIEREVN